MNTLKGTKYFIEMNEEQLTEAIHKHRLWLWNQGVACKPDKDYENRNDLRQMSYKDVKEFIK